MYLKSSKQNYKAGSKQYSHAAFSEKSIYSMGTISLSDVCVAGWYSNPNLQEL